MHVTVLSKVLHVVTSLAYWWVLWLLTVVVGGDGETGVLVRGERDRVLTVRVSGPQAAVVVVRSGKGADHVFVAIDTGASKTSAAGLGAAGTTAIDLATRRGARRSMAGRPTARRSAVGR
jgi:hypothetical protein